MGENKWIDFQKANRGKGKTRDEISKEYHQMKLEAQNKKQQEIKEKQQEKREKRRKPSIVKKTESVVPEPVRETSRARESVVEPVVPKPVVVPAPKRVLVRQQKIRMKISNTSRK